VAERPKAVNIAGLIDQSVAFELKTEAPEHSGDSSRHSAHQGKAYGVSEDHPSQLPYVRRLPASPTNRDSGSLPAS
jgi:hypothetical protein